MKSEVLHFLIPEGNPNGMKVIGLEGWSGKCFVVPRQKLKELKERPETNQPGLYFLFGIDDETREKVVYIGESENFYSRISNHDSNKKFWDIAIVFTGDINRADVKYLEHKATKKTHDAGRMEMKNKIQPQENTLSEFSKVSAEKYFEKMNFILSAIGYEIFDAAEDSLIDNQKYYLKVDQTDATAMILDNGDLLVKKGSLGRVRETESFGGWIKVARERFIKEGKMIESKENLESYELTQDIIFKSPSAAAATLSGRPINGWTSWKDEKGKTLDENLRK